MDSFRSQSRLFQNTISSEALSSDEYHYLANSFFEIPKDQRQAFLNRLKKNYYSIKPNNDEDDEFLILSNLMTDFSLEMSEDDFSYNADILSLLINSCFRHSSKYESLFESYLSFSLQFLQSDNLIFISSTLSVIRTLTSFSEALSIYIPSIIPPELFLNFIMQAIDFFDNQIYQDIMNNSSKILRNIFYPVEKKRIRKKTIKHLFECAYALFQSEIINTYECCSEILMCIRDSLVLNRLFCLKILKSYDFIPYFNALLRSDAERTKIYVLLIFLQLIRIDFEIRLEDIDMLYIIQMITPETNLTLPSIQVFATFLQKCPDSSDVFLQLDILPSLDSILREGTLNSRLQALNIINTLINNASQENKLQIIQIPSLVDSLLDMTCNVNSPVVLLIFSILRSIIQISDINGVTDQIKSIFMEPKNLSILDELANGEESTGEFASQILDSLNEAK